MGCEHDTLDSVSVDGADRNPSSVGITDGRRLTHLYVSQALSSLVIQKEPESICITVQINFDLFILF